MSIKTPILWALKLIRFRKPLLSAIGHQYDRNRSLQRGSSRFRYRYNIMMSAGEQDRAKPLDAGANGYLKKPFDVSQILSVVELNLSKVGDRFP